MKILAVDTSTDYLSVAISDGAKILAGYHRPSHRNHSRLLVPAIAGIMKKAGLKFSDIDAFAVSIGPGSFTGLRIGVVTLKGLAYSLGKPIITIPTLDLIAKNAGPFKGIVCPVIDAKKKKVYAAIYRYDGRKLKRLTRYLLVPAEDLLKMTAKYDKVLFLGDGVGLVGAPEKIKAWHPRASVAAILAAESFRKKRFITPEKLEPMYIYSRECDITGR
jgi:tRNA threonylcarbamoyladenosine biosynthesis protein TsaB